MAEPRHTSPLENIPPVAKLAESIKYAMDKRWDPVYKAYQKALPEATLLRQKFLTTRWTLGVPDWWARRMTAASAQVKEAKATMARLAPIRNVIESTWATAIRNGLAYVGGAVTFSEQIDKSTATTFQGKVVDGVLAGTADFLLNKTLAAPIDLASHFGLKSAGLDPKGWTIGENVGSGLRAIVTSAEAGITGDYRGVAAFDEKAKSGGYGPPAQALADLGADIGKDGLGATLSANISFYLHGFRLAH